MKSPAVASFFMTEPALDSQEVLISPPAEAASENGQSQPAHQPDGDKASTEGLQGKPKAPLMKNSSTTITLSDWVTSTTKIKVFFDQIVIDHDRSIGHVHKLSEDRVQRRYDDLKAAPPVDYIQDFFFIKSFVCLLLPTAIPNGLYCLPVRRLAEISASICVPKCFWCTAIVFSHGLCGFVSWQVFACH